MASSLPRDIRAFLADYPNTEPDASASANLEFYRNARRCRPDRLYIDEIHTRWMGDYSTLERNHGFIQWLFPIQELGMNYESQPLERHEREEMRQDDEVLERILRSYRLMLDFYGMQLVSTETGLLARTEPEENCMARYRHLIRSQHNYLRISRILKCLSEMGLERLNAGFLLHVLNEQSEHDLLNVPYLRSSMDGWWANCIRNDEEREWVRTMIDRVRGGELVFTRQMYESALERRKETGSLAERSQDEGTDGDDIEGTK